VAYIWDHSAKISGTLADEYSVLHDWDNNRPGRELGRARTWFGAIAIVARLTRSGVL
jgi:hypothetical protein